MTITAKAHAIAVYVSPGRSLPMVHLDTAELVAGCGIKGDRRFSTSTKPKNQVTLIEDEALRAVGTGRPVVDDLFGFEQKAHPHGSARRNIITKGVALNHLVGVTFQVGTATLRGIELCEPCGHLAQLTSTSFERALVHRGGLRAEIVASGEVCAGDAIALIDEVLEPGA